MDTAGRIHFLEFRVSRSAVAKAELELTGSHKTLTQREPTKPSTLILVEMAPFSLMVARPSARREMLLVRNENSSSVISYGDRGETVSRQKCEIRRGIFLAVLGFQ